jgi:hypothetical protein
MAIESEKQRKKYQKLYELAAKKTDKKRSKARAADAADRAAGKPVKLREGLTGAAEIKKKFIKLADRYEKKNMLFGGLDSPRFKVVSDMEKKMKRANSRVYGDNPVKGRKK